MTDSIPDLDLPSLDFVISTGIPFVSPITGHTFHLDDRDTPSGRIRAALIDTRYIDKQHASR